MPDWWRQPSHRPSERFCTMLCALKCGDFGAPVPIGMGDGEPTCRRGSVHRSLAGFRMGDHPSMRPTREDRRADHPLPVWPCSGWGLPSRPGHPGRWCALTAPFHPHLYPVPVKRISRGGGPSAVCSLWHFPAGHPDWQRASILSWGAPTFLNVPPGGGRRGHPVGSPSPTSLAGHRPFRNRLYMERSRRPVLPLAKGVRGY